MARIKTTYGKRPKANTTFTDLWSSPNRAPLNPNPAPAPADAVEDITSTLDNLEIREKEKQEKKERSRKEKRDRAALQAVDGNAASPAARSEKQGKQKDSHGATKKPTATVVPKTPQRLKKLLPKKKLEPVEQTPVEQTPVEHTPVEQTFVEQTPKSERKRRRGKRAIPTICLDSDDDNAIMDEHADALILPSQHDHHQPKPRSRALSSPQPARSADLLPPTTSTTKRRSKSPSVLVTPRHPSAPPDPLVAYTKPLLRLCADRQGRKAPTPFALWAAALEPYFSVAKIAEASYGEVYRLSLRRRPEFEHMGLSASDESVLKMIALKPPVKNGGNRNRKKKTKAQRMLEEKIEGMSGVESVAGEIRLLQRMAHVPGFTNFRDVRVLKGCPSESFARAWGEWNDGREEDKRSIFPDPAEKGSYDDDQLWAVIEMQDAGTDLENLKMEDVGGVFGVWDIFWSVTLALGKGEEEARFEHRDLHMGNICIRPANANRPIAAPSPSSSSVADVARNLNFTGLESTIIDYTLSRAQMTHPAASPDPDESEVAFLDLEADPALFEGDAAVEYQYEMYRCMRAAMYLDDPAADVEERWEEALRSGRTWVGFHPQTNLVWLHFILHEMMAQVAKTDEEEGKSAGKARRGEGTKGTKAKSKPTKTRSTKKKKEKKASGKEGNKTTGSRKAAVAVVIPDSDDDDDNDSNDAETSPSSSSSSSVALAQQQQQEEDAAERAALAQLIANKRRKLDKILRKVQKLLDPGRGRGWAAQSGLHSVKDLVALALEEAWLDEEDVIAVPQLGPGTGDDGDCGEGSLLEMVRGMGMGV